MGYLSQSVNIAKLAHLTFTAWFAGAAAFARKPYLSGAKCLKIQKSVFDKNIV
jgi:hypothetical protein